MRAYDFFLRQEAIELYEKGERKTEISKRLSVSYYTVLNWIKRYKKQGISGLKASYDRCGGHSKVSKKVKKEAIRMKSKRRGWGGEYVNMKLKQKYPEAYVPSGRQLQRYFNSAGLTEERSRLPSDQGGRHWARSAFYRVQVDAKEQIQTKYGNWCSYLTFTDEYTGATLEALVFPL